MGRLIFGLLALLLADCGSSHDSGEGDTVYAPYQMDLTVPEGALAFFAEAIKDDYYRDSEFVATVVTTGPAGNIHFEDSRVNLHGEGSILLPRKSFEVRLPMRVPPFGEGLALKKFLLVAMEEDYGYYRNFLCYGLLRDHLGLFLGEMQYTRVSLNGADQGLYLLVERSQDAIERRFPEAAVMRRNYDNGWFPKGNLAKDPARVDAYYAELAHFGELSGLYQGQQLVDSLRAYVDLDQYLAWLAFNRLVRNGDYTDEVFFYKETPTTAQWKIAVWDYEDIWADPHAGIARAGSWVYCIEDKLDSAIADTPELTVLYHTALRSVMQRLTPEVLAQHFDTIREQLLPWFADPSLARINANFSEDPMNARIILEQELENRQQELLQRRDTLLGPL